MWLVATYWTAQVIENEGQKGEFIMLFCGVRIPHRRLFSFSLFNLDQVSISHGPNRKQVAHTEEVFKER